MAQVVEQVQGSEFNPQFYQKRRRRKRRRRNKKGTKVGKHFKRCELNLSIPPQ
jgi:hypothetical protein